MHCTPLRIARAGRGCVCRDGGVVMGVLTYVVVDAEEGRQGDHRQETPRIPEGYRRWYADRLSSHSRARESISQGVFDGASC